MKKHIACVHKSINLSGDCQLSLSFGPSKQSSITEFRAPRLPAASKTKQDEFYRALAWMCAIDLRPMNIVNGIGFKKVCHVLNPTFVVPSRPTVTKHLCLLYDEVKNSIVQSLENEFVSITTDLWTSLGNVSYMTITAHYIGSDWKLQCRVLGTRVLGGKHTGVNIAKEVYSMAREFGIKNNHIVSITTDNASNMKAAAAEAEIYRVQCFAHTLQLAIGGCLAKRTISLTLGKCRKLVS